MKLRNKKTGEIRDVQILGNNFLIEAKDFPNDTTTIVKSLAELEREWEDAPEEPKEYWYIDWTPEIGTYHTRDVDSDADKRQKEIGNYFETKEEAERAVEKLKAWKRLKDNGFEFCGWQGFYGEANYRIPCVEEAEENPKLAKQIEKDLDLLFRGEE